MARNRLIPSRARAVARRGLLALPATETVYWQGAVDSEGKPLDGSCRYAMTGAALDARWWSVTVYDTAGYLMPNALNAWSFNGAAISEAEKGGWRVEVGPQTACQRPLAANDGGSAVSSDAARV
jgi:hypothetical protein